MFIFVPSDKKTGFTVLKLWSGHDFHTEIYKGADSIKTADAIIILNLCTSSDDALYL